MLGMERPAIAVFAQFIMKGSFHRMAGLVYVTDVNKNSKFLLGRCKLVHILFTVYNSIVNFLKLKLNK